jgi:hypothetical protein
MQHRSREVRQDLVVLRARDALVAARTELINATRGLVKSMGTRLPKGSSPSFAQKVEETVPIELRDALMPLVRMAAALSDCIQGYDEKIEKLGHEKDEHTALLRQVKGVGPITSLAYVLTLENPDRFVKSRDVGPYLGLVPKQEDSGGTHFVPKPKKRTALLRKLKEIFRRYVSQPVGRVIELINPILRGWVHYFAVGHSSRCFSYIKLWVEKRVRRHLMRARERKGFGWKRWSTQWLYNTLGLFNDYRVVRRAIS